MRLADALLLALALRPFPAAAQEPGEPIAHQYILRLADSAEPQVLAEALAREHGLAPVQFFGHAARGFSALIPPGRLEAVRSDARVRALGPDRWVAAAPPGAEWPSGLGSGVAVLGSGIAGGEDPALPRGGGLTLVTTEAQPAARGEDDHGSGTALGRGLSSANPGALLWAVKVLGREGRGSLSDLIAGLDWLLDPVRPMVLRAAVVSLAGECPSCGPGSSEAGLEALRETLEALAKQGVSVRSLARNTFIPSAAASPAAAPAQASFALGEVYAFPNPAVGGQTPTVHVEAGAADSVDIRIYDLAGDLAHEASLAGAPALIDDGQGPQPAYEHRWDSSGAGSGVYVYVVRARKAGHADLKAVGKLALVK